MPRISSERLALAAALAVALAGGCVRREIDVKPFAIRAEALEGPPVELPPGLTSAVLTITGTAARESDTSLRVANATVPYTVRLSFSNEASRDVVLPDQLDGVEVIVHLFAVPGTVAPDGTPIPFPAFRVATGTTSAGRYQFLVGESPFETGSDVAGVPRPLVRENPPFTLTALPPIEDYPFFEIISDRVYFEPADCGLQYYDLLRVRREFGQDVLSVLRSDETMEVSVPEGDPEPWTVRNVLSWHRVGSCGDDAPVWTQLAAWRK